MRPTLKANLSTTQKLCTMRTKRVYAQIVPTIHARLLRITMKQNNIITHLIVYTVIFLCHYGFNQCIAKYWFRFRTQPDSKKHLKNAFTLGIGTSYYPDRVKVWKGYCTKCTWLSGLCGG